MIIYRRIFGLALMAALLLVMAHAPPANAGPLSGGKGVDRLLNQAWDLHRRAGQAYLRGKSKEAFRLYRRSWAVMNRAFYASRGRSRGAMKKVRRRFFEDMLTRAQMMIGRAGEFYEKGRPDKACPFLRRGWKLARFAGGMGGGRYGRLFSRSYRSMALVLGLALGAKKMRGVLGNCLGRGTAAMLNRRYQHALRQGRRLARTRKKRRRRLGHPGWPVEVRVKIRWLLGHKRKFLRSSLRLARRYVPMILRVFKAHGIPDFMAYMPIVESGFQRGPVSRAGAVGLWQFMPKTARDYGLRVGGGIDERLSPRKSTRAAALYLKNLHRRFGDWPLVMAAYNAGEGLIETLVARHGLKTYWAMARAGVLPRETRGFVTTVIAAMIISQNPKKYGF